MVIDLPQFIERGSTNSVPFFIYACERPMRVFAADSSRKTNFEASTVFIQRANFFRAAATSGRSCSAGRGRFF